MKPIVVKIERYYSYPDIKQQTPNNSFIWNNIHFTEEPISACDYLFILDYPKQDVSIQVNPNHIFHFCLEPANEVSKYRQYANKKVAQIFNQIKSDGKNTLCYPALPWHVGLGYDDLKGIAVESLEKEDKIVWVTSNQRTSKQHNTRMDFLDSLRDLPFVHLYGRGIQDIESKWEVMKNAKYAIAFENFKNDYNWTEKIVDCFLSYCIPIYYGCDRITDYFDSNSIIQLDPKDKHINLKLKELVQSNYWENHLEALKDSREKVLNEYQMFSLFEKIILENELKHGVFQKENRTFIELKGQQAYFDNVPLTVTIEKEFHKLIRKINQKISK